LNNLFVYLFDKIKYKIGKMITINPENCPQDHRCPLIRICPKDAISQDGNSLPKIDSYKCVGCMLCISKCPLGAVEKIK